MNASTRYAQKFYHIRMFSFISSCSHTESSALAHCAPLEATAGTPLPGLYRCGDSTTAGIGVPAVASSGAQCANALLSVWEQLEMNEKIRM